MGRVHERNIQRIEQERAADSQRSGQIDATVKVERQLTRNFRRTAVSRRHPPPGADAPVKPRDVVGPDDNLPSVAAIQRIGTDLNIKADVSTRGILYRGIFALEIAADECRAAAAAAAHVHHGIAEQPDVIAEHLHGATLRATAFAARGDPAGTRHGGRRLQIAPAV